MHWRHELVSELLVPLDFGNLVAVPLHLEAVVTRPPISVDLRPDPTRPGPDDLLGKGD